MVMTSTSASVEANLVTFIVKNLLSKDAIVTFVVDTELYFIQMFILNGLFFRVKVPFNIPLHTMYGRYNMCFCCSAGIICVCVCIVKCSANRVIISLLAEIKSELIDVKKGIATNTQMLQSLSAGSTCEVGTEDLGITLPLQNFQALDEMEEQLVHDEKFRKSLVSMVCYF